MEQITKSSTLTIDSSFTQDPLDASFFSSYYTNDCIATNNIYVDSHKIDKIIKRVVETFGENEVRVSDSREFGFVIIAAENLGGIFAMMIKADLSPGSSSELLFVGTIDKLAMVHEKIKDLTVHDTPDDDYEITIINFYYRKNILTTGRTEKMMSDFSYVADELYPRINVDDLVNAYIESTESILILTGEPGTGKTTFLKKVMSSIAAHKKEDVIVAYIKDKDILQDNETWSSLASNDYDILVFDDLDDSLGARSVAGDNSFISQLLSFSDGIFDKNTKILITTNRPIDDIDTAVIRPGRCFDILQMPALKYSEALAVWTDLYELDEQSFWSAFGNARTDITQAYLSSEAKSIQGKSPRSYLRDQSISIRKQFMK